MKLGRKVSAQVFKPALVQDVSAAEVHTGPLHTLVITAEQGLMAFGENEFGQAGNGKIGTVMTPEAVQSIGSVKAAACGLHYSLAVTSTGELYEWGYAGRSMGMLSRLFGRAAPANQCHPIPEKVEVVQNVCDVAAGELHFLAVRETGEVLAWGDNEHGSCGTGALLDSYKAPRSLDYFAQLPESDQALRVFACGASSAVLTRLGKVYMWGLNDEGQLPFDRRDKEQSQAIQTVPREVLLPARVVDVAMGRSTSAFITDQGEAYISGLKLWSYPYKVPLPDNFHPVQACCGEDYFAFVGQQGEVLAFGGPFPGAENRSQELPEQPKLVEAGFFPGKVIQLRGAYDYCAAIIA
jgi:alpha-tubulin suppressor-like RCC1 family protein